MLRAMPPHAPDTIEVEPRSPATRSVIWLHGLGADGHDFEPIVPMFRLEPDLAVRFVFPNAPVRAVTINGGMRMRAWYDIRGMDFDRREDEAGIHDSSRLVAELVARENERGIATARIVLAGFSQGGAIALHAGLRHGEALAGIVALSTYLVRARELETERAPANLATPIFQAHGSHDPMVTPERGAAARAELKRLGHALEFHSYPMAHQVCPQEIDDIGAFLRRVLA